MKKLKPKQGKIFIVSGPSQVGKDSVVRALWRHRSLRLEPIITFTSRAMRPGEKQGVTYHFVSEAEFKKLIKQGQMLEWAIVRSSYFGTPKKPVMTAINSGKNVLMQIDVQGGQQIKKILPQQTALIFITAESIQEIKRRLFSSTLMTMQQKKSRWKEALKELLMIPKYDFVVTNKLGELKNTVNTVENIIKSDIKPKPLTRKPKTAILSKH